MALQMEDVARLLLAVLLGGIIGAEREYRDKTAGFRTIIFICVGATLFTIFSIRLGGSNDPARVAANIVSGVGFLGAGAIMRDARRVTGLTTASTIWLAAALGMGVGAGHYMLAGAATLVVLIVLLLFPRIEAWIGNSDTRTYEVVCPVCPGMLDELESMARSSGLRVVERQRAKAGEDMICNLMVVGRPAAHEQLTEKLLTHTEVKGFKV